jgi:hypothetical protein
MASVAYFTASARREQTYRDQKPRWDPLSIKGHEI